MATSRRNPWSNSPLQSRNLTNGQQCDIGRILVTVLGMVAEMERRFILERQKVGIEAAKMRGVYKGRKPSVPVGQVRKMHGDGKDRRRSPRLWACPV
jgi:DNA invertase Pin-like site-specific DNA recombinase